MRGIVGIVELGMTDEGMCRSHALRDDLDERERETDGNFTGTCVHDDVVRLSREALRELLGIAAAVIRDRQCRGHIGFDGNLVVEVFPVPAGQCRCLAGDVRQRVHVDDVTRDLVVVDTDLDGTASEAALEGTLSYIVDGALDRSGQVIMDIVEDSFGLHLVHVRQTRDTCEHIRLGDLRLPDEHVLLTVPVVVCNMQIHTTHSPFCCGTIHLHALCCVFLTHPQYNTNKNKCQRIYL